MKKTILTIILAITAALLYSCIYEFPSDFMLTTWEGESEELGTITVQFTDDQMTIATEATETIQKGYRKITKDRLSIYNGNAKGERTVEFIEIKDINELSMILTWHYPDDCTPVRKVLLISNLYKN